MTEDVCDFCKGVSSSSYVCVYCNGTGEWISEYQKNGKDSFDKYMKEYDAHQIEKVGKKMRKMMWPDSTE